MGTDDLHRKRKKLDERKAGNRKPKAGSYLIVTEGEQTEPNYFRGLAKKVREACAGGRIDVPSFDIQGEGRKTVPLVKEAARINGLPEKACCGRDPGPGRWMLRYNVSGPGGRHAARPQVRRWKT